MQHRGPIPGVPEPGSGEPAVAILWHAVPVWDALAKLDCGDAGLSSAEAAGRLKHHELNRLTLSKPRSVLMRFLAQFNNALIYVLLVAAGISLALGEVVDAAVIAGVGVIGIVQEGKAEQTLDAIRDMLSLNASVTRDGRRLGSGAASIHPQAGCPNSIFMRQSLRSLVAGVIL
jgi:hypothetical protein